MRRGVGAPVAFVALVVALVTGAYAAAVLAGWRGYQPSADSLYHFSVAREIARGHLVPDVARSLPFTVLRDMPVDHYWGYHLLLAPFALAGDAEAGMKIATVALFAGIFVSLYLFLRAREVPYAWAWAVMPALVSTQDWRYLQLRGGQLALPLLFGMIQVAFFEPRALRRRAWLVAIGYVALLSYNGGVILLPMHVAGVLALLLARRLAPGQLGDPAFTALGMALGLTVNPYMDARASTWRFFALHVGAMGRDSAHLYDDQDIAEFHGFPLRVAFAHPEWLLLLAGTLASIALVAFRERPGAASRAPRESREGVAPVVLAGLALAGVALTAQAMRTREYSVPLAFALFAVLAPRVRESLVGASLAVPLLAAAFVLHREETLRLDRGLPTHQYDGALPLLEANGDHPILNIAEADYCMLRWQWDRVVCVQALSRYFIYPYQELFHDVWELHDRADTSSETPDVLRRFWDRGVRLVAVHALHNRMAPYAEAHPELLHRVFVSPINGAAIYAIDGAALGAGP
jgi:hypothetical protein